MDIYLSSDTLEYYKTKSKLYQYLYNSLSTSYFRATHDCLTMYLKGSMGLFKIDLPCQSDIDETKYFSIDFSKWTNALIKFDGCESLTISIQDKLVRMSVEGSPDIINLGFATGVEGSEGIKNFDVEIENRKKSILDANLSIDITDEIADDLALVNSLFIPQQDVNSIGLGSQGLIYAVRSVILKALFTSELPEKFFKNLDDGEDYVYLHKYMIGFINHVYSVNPTFNFSEDYSVVYWEDDSSAIYLTQPYRELAIPSDEDLGTFTPSGETYGEFSVDIETLKESLSFFDGFYAGSVWKPIKFEAVAHKDVNMRYDHPTAKINKSLNVAPGMDGTFSLDSDTIKKILSKVKDKRLDKTAPLEASFSYDNDAPGVLCEIGNAYRVVFCKLNDEE